jgi:hypothetical protein
VDIRINDEPYFTEVKVMQVLKRYLKQDYFANVQVWAGRKENSKKRDYCFRFGCQEDTWSLKEKTNIPEVDLIRLAGDVETNPGPHTTLKRRMNPVWDFWIPIPDGKRAYRLLLICITWLGESTAGGSESTHHQSTPSCW